jgi:hypothetical protein
MNLACFKSKLRRNTGVSLIVALLATSTAFAKPLTPIEVHNKIVKLGAGNWIWVQETNGVTLHGVLTNIDVNTFGIELYNDPASVTPVAYNDVVRMRTPLSGKAVIAIVLIPVAAGIAGGFILHHEYEVNKNQMPPTPVLP